MKTLLSLAFGIATLTAQAAHVQVLVLDKDGKPVENAVVVLRPVGPSAVTKRALPKEVNIANQGMAFVPAVSIAAVGAKLRFTNFDRFDHHVRGTAAGALQFSQANEGGFELRMDPAKADGKPGATQEVGVAKPGAVLLGCHMHSSMRGHVYVSDSPWAVKTDANGIARFDDAAEGTTQASVWQADQLIDLPAQSVAVAASHSAAAPLKLEFKLQVAPRRRRA